MRIGLIAYLLACLLAWVRACLMALTFCSVPACGMFDGLLQRRCRKNAVRFSVIFYKKSSWYTLERGKSVIGWVSVGRLSGGLGVQKSSWGVPGEPLGSTGWFQMHLQSVTEEPQGVRGDPKDVPGNAWGPPNVVLGCPGDPWRALKEFH